MQLPRKIYLLALVVLGYAQLVALGFAQPVDPTVRIPNPVIQNPSDNTGKLANIATPGFVGTGDNALVADFVVTEQSRYVLIRAVGPSLSRLGIASFLPRPRISLYDAAGALITTTASWTTSLTDIDRAGITLLAREVGAFPLVTGSDDAVLHRRLTPGAYAVVVSSADTQSGVALVEVYASPTYRVPET